MTLKLGKTPARPNAVQLKLVDYLPHEAFPAIPAEFGHERLISTWGMNGNDQYGCCVWAGAAHETEMFNAEAGRSITVTTDNSLADYAAVTGFSPHDPSTDQGTDMQVAAAYRQKTGIGDSAGVRHKVGAYIALTPGDVTQLAAAVRIFGAVGVGIQFPDFAMRQFNAGKPWDTRPGLPNIEGGHYVPVVARRAGMFDVITWGRIQQMTAGFYRRFCDEAFAYLSPETLNGAGLTPEGFNLAQLRADLQAVTQR